MKTLHFSRDAFDLAHKFKVAGVRGDVSLHKGYNKADDGIVYGLQSGILIKSHYTAEDKAHFQRMREMEPIINGEDVLIDGNVYTARILGNYSDCVIFDLKTLLIE